MTDICHGVIENDTDENNAYKRADDILFSVLSREPKETMSADVVFDCSKSQSANNSSVKQMIDLELNEA